MSSPLPVKRRRLNDATNTLSKPFRSPLKPTTNTPSKPTPKAPGTPFKPSNLTHSTFSSPASSQEHSTLSTRPSNVDSDPITLAAEQSIRSLDLQIRTLTLEIDTLEQAAKLRSSKLHNSLPALIAKWRSATQSAADELYPTARAKLESMGGVKTLIENERRRELGGGWGREGSGLDEFEAEEARMEEEAEVGYDENGEAVGEAEREERRRDVRRFKRGNKEGQERREREAEEGFTMEMMLRSLGIEADVVGWDSREQRWVSG